MTQPETTNPVERLLSLTLLACAVAWYALILWRQIDPDADPRETLDRLQERYRSWQAHRRSIQDTLQEIADLPESEA